MATALTANEDRVLRNKLADKPLAADGLKSYRIPSRYGYCMIGARSVDDAMREAARSVQNPQRGQLQVWCAQQRKYIPA